MNRLLIFDTETTGISKRNSKIWQLTASKIDLDNLVEESDFKYFNGYIKPLGYPNIKWNKGVEERCGVSFEQLSEFYPPDKVFNHFLNFLNHGEYSWDNKFIPVAYKSDFDMFFIIKYAKEMKSMSLLNDVLYESAIDLFTISISYIRSMEIPTKSFKQFDVCQALNIDVSDLKAHDAKDDIKATYRLMKELINRGVLWSHLKN